MSKIITYTEAGRTIPVHITDEALSKLTLEQVAAKVVPQGVAWVEVQSAPALPIDDRRASVWERVKAERSRRESGGVQVSGHWFQTDADSRIKMLRLDSKASTALVAGGSSSTVLTVAGQSLQWKTTENGLVPMTVGLAQGIAAAIEILDALAYSRAEVLRAQVAASANPESIDITTGWPAIYTGA